MAPGMRSMRSRRSIFHLTWLQHLAVIPRHRRTSTPFHARSSAAFWSGSRQQRLRQRARSGSRRPPSWRRRISVPTSGAAPPDEANMPDRQNILRTVADPILQLPSAHVVCVGIDGVDGAGKSMFGDELAQRLTAAGRSVIRASVDGFHNTRAIRYRLGRQSPEGYFRDSYNYAQLKALLLDPLSPGGNGRYRTAAFDHRTDQPVTVPEAQAAPGNILVFDGI